VDRDRVASLRLPPIEQSYTARDTMLYALGLGYGSDPLSATQLPFVCEADSEPLRVVPSMCLVLAHPGFWVGDPTLGIDWRKLLHGEQSFEIHRPLSSAGRVRGEYEIVAIDDKGPDKGAVVHQVKTIFDAADGARLASCRSVLFLRGDGGCGSVGEPPPAAAPLPERAPDRSCTLATSPQSALLYRLSGDYNPIHADPGTAAKAGFARPILHGLCTLGMAVRAAADELAEGRAERVRAVSARFVKPVYPGETLRVDLFVNGNDVRFRVSVVERDVLVLDRGSLTLELTD
jgi:acyl dehydratase